MHLKLAKPFSPVTDLKKVCADPEANPIAVADALDMASSREWRDWDPETLRTYAGLRESDVAQLDKVMACQVALTNPDVFEDWTLLIPVVTAFNHRRSSFEWADVPSYIELAWGLKCLHQLDRYQQTLHPDVQKLVGVVCMEGGLLYFPWSNPPLTLPGNDLFKGLVSDSPEVLAALESVKNLLASGMLDREDITEDGDVDEKDLVEAQAAKLVSAQKYIRSQKPDDPGDYGAT